jgi:plasmid stabilization system protein ParE
MNVRYTATALLEVNELLAYIAERSPRGAAAVKARIDRTVATLAEFPEMAQRTDEPSVRRVPLGSYPYLIFYAMEREEIAILHVRHSARRPLWEGRR